MTGHVDHVIDPAQDAVVAIGGLHRAVVTKVWPVAPVLALRVLAVFAVVRVNVSLRISPDSLEDSWPRVADANVSGPAGAWWDLVPFLVQNHGIDPRSRGSRTAGFHGIQRRLGAAQEATVFRLPPGIYDHRLPLAYHVVVPAPHVRLDRLAHGGHVLEVVVVLAWLVPARFVQHSECSRGRIEN